MLLLPGFCCSSEAATLRIKRRFTPRTRSAGPKLIAYLRHNILEAVSPASPRPSVARPPAGRHGRRARRPVRAGLRGSIAGRTRRPPGTVHFLDRPGRGRSAQIGRSPMSAASLPSIATTHAHPAFDAALARIDAAIRYHFRRWPRDRREEAIADARAVTWAAWHGLIRRGKDPVAVGVVAIAANACRAVKKGRTVGANRSVGRGAMDVHHPRARLRDGAPRRLVRGAGRRGGGGLAGLAGLGPPLWPGGRGGVPGRLRGLAGRPAAAEAAGRRAAGRGAGDGRGGAPARGDARGGQPGAAVAGPLLGAVPGRGRRPRCDRRPARSMDPGLAGAAIVDPPPSPAHFIPVPPQRSCTPWERERSSTGSCPGRPDRGRRRRRPGPFVGRLRGDGGPPGRPRPP